jgi:hypothetical protein
MYLWRYEHLCVCTVLKKRRKYSISVVRGPGSSLKTDRKIRPVRNLGRVKGVLGKAQI